MPREINMAIRGFWSGEVIGVNINGVDVGSEFNINDVDVGGDVIIDVIQVGGHVNGEINVNYAESSELWAIEFLLVSVFFGFRENEALKL